MKGENGGKRRIKSGFIVTLRATGKTPLFEECRAAGPKRLCSKDTWAFNRSCE